MPKPAKGPRLGSGPSHERLMLANLATALFEHGRIRTTETKARRLRPVAERLITFAKRGDLHARRQVLSVVRDKQVVTTLFDEIGPRYAERFGGYTRIVKLGPRKGDNAPMAIVELVEGRTGEQEVVGEAERARGTRFRRRSAATGRTREAAQELARESETAAAVAAEADAATEDVGDEAAPVPTEGDVEAAVETAAVEQVAVPTEGGDTEVVTDSPVEPEAAVEAEPAAAETTETTDESEPGD